KIAEVEINRAERPKYGNYLYGAFGRDFATREGKRIMVVGLTKNQWDSLRDATGLHEAFAQVEKQMNLNLDEEGDRFAAREVIAAILKPWIITRSLAEVSEQFDAHGVCWAPYQTFTELVEKDPRCSTVNPMFSRVQQPGIRERCIDKAKAVPADAILLDLEDSVAAADKAKARELVAAVVPAFPKNGRLLYVRPNDLTSGLLEEDLAAIVGPHLDGILLPK